MVKLYDDMPRQSSIYFSPDSTRVAYVIENHYSKEDNEGTTLWWVAEESQ